MQKIDLTPELLSDLIGLVYDSAFEGTQWQSLLTRICDLFPGAMACVYGYEDNTILQQYVLVGTPSFLTDDFEFSTVSFVERRTFSEGLGMAPLGMVVRSNLFYTDEDWEASDLYRRYLHPIGVRNMLLLKIDGMNRRGAVLAFMVPEDPALDAQIHDPLFELLKLLSPHAVRALRLARTLTLAKRSTEVFSGFLDGILLPMLVTDETGHYLFANAAGRRVLERSDPLTLTAAGDLVLSTAEDSRALLRRIQAISQDMTANGMRIEANDGAPLLLALTPFRPAMREASAVDRHLLADEQLCAVFVGQSDGDAISHHLLEDVFDLTPREAEVCSRLMQGAAAKDIAIEAERSLKTVRNQIQVIYDKVGVTSNVALMDVLSVFRTVGGMFTPDAGDTGVQRLQGQAQPGRA